MQSNETSPDFELWAQSQRREHDDQSKRWWRGPTDHEHEDHEREEFERLLPLKWQRYLEERAESLARRRREFVAAYGRAARFALETTVDDPTIALVAPYRDVRDQILVLAGPVGVGKTVAAAWLAWQQPYLPTFVTATGIAATSRYDDEAEWRTASSLVVDDMGAEYLDAKGSLASDIDALINDYYSSERLLIVTTNLTPAQFAERYGARVMDRLREGGVWISVTGESRR